MTTERETFDTTLKQFKVYSPAGEFMVVATNASDAAQIVAVRELVDVMDCYAVHKP